MASFAKPKFLAQRRVLIVEDDPDVASALTLLVAHPRILTEVAPNGVRAITKAREMKPSLILLDVGLPVVAGDQVFHVLRDDRELRHVPVIFVTAHADQGALKLEGLGSFEWLKKPFQEQQLRDKVLAALRLKEEASGYRLQASGRDLPE